MIDGGNLPLWSACALSMRALEAGTGADLHKPITFDMGLYCTSVLFVVHFHFFEISFWVHR